MAWVSNTFFISSICSQTDIVDIAIARPQPLDNNSLQQSSVASTTVADILQQVQLDVSKDVATISKSLISYFVSRTFHFINIFSVSSLAQTKSHSENANNKASVESIEIPLKHLIGIFADGATQIQSLSRVSARMSDSSIKMGDASITRGAMTSIVKDVSKLIEAILGGINNCKSLSFKSISLSQTFYIYLHIIYPIAKLLQALAGDVINGILALVQALGTVVSGFPGLQNFLNFISSIVKAIPI